MLFSIYIPKNFCLLSTTSITLGKIKYFFFKSNAIDDHGEMGKKVIVFGFIFLARSTKNVIKREIVYFIIHIKKFKNKRKK